MPEAIIYIVCWLLKVMFPLKGEVWSTEIELVYISWLDTIIIFL